MQSKKIKMPACAGWPVWVVVMGLVFGFSVLGVTVVKVKAQEESVKVDEVMSEVVESEFEVEEQDTKDTNIVEEAVDYYLPYPGILPDHPMYWLKMIRDKVQLLLTTNAVGKVEKQLLYADKRLGAGWALIEGNKVQLGVTTLTKAEKYLEQANFAVSQVDGEEELKARLGKATRKHNEVLLIIKDKVGEEYQSVMDKMIEMTGVELEVEESGDEIEEEVEEVNEVDEIIN